MHNLGGCNKYRLSLQSGIHKIHKAKKCLKMKKTITHDGIDKSQKERLNTR
jgi:hypothetical protein